MTKVLIFLVMALIPMHRNRCMLQGTIVHVSVTGIEILGLTPG